MKLVTIYEHIVKELAAYHGGPNITPKSRAIVKYFTPAKKYAHSFEKAHRLELGPFAKSNGRISAKDYDVIETDDYNLLDLRDLGIKTSYDKIQQRLIQGGISPSDEWVEFFKNYINGPNLYVFMGFKPQPYFSPLTAAMEDLWHQIGKKYDGIIIRENDPENLKLGDVDAYAIITKRLKRK